LLHRIRVALGSFAWFESATVPMRCWPITEFEVQSRATKVSQCGRGLRLGRHPRQSLRRDFARRGPSRDPRNKCRADQQRPKSTDSSL